MSARAMRIRSMKFVTDKSPNKDKQEVGVYFVHSSILQVQDPGYGIVELQYAIGT